MWPQCSAKRLAMGQNVLANWQLELPGGILALITYLLILRLFFELTVGMRDELRLARALAWLTDPVVRTVGAITPRAVPKSLITPCAIFWVLTARIVLGQLAAALAMWWRFRG